MLTPRHRRYLPLWEPIHATSRGVDRRQIFFQPRDYEGFLALLRDAALKFKVDVFAYCAMPNHFHLLVMQRVEGAIPAFLHRLVGGSACHYRRRTSSVGLGHVYQRRYWSRVVINERHYLTTLRYVEDNPRRAGLVRRSEDWPWGSLWERVNTSRSIVVPSLVPLSADWVEVVNQDLADEELRSLRPPTRSRPSPRVPARPSLEQPLSATEL
jgi:putative transposase